MRFAGKTALVTGGSRGIGRATALRLAAEGADVAVHYLHSQAAAEAVASEIRAGGRRAITVAGDVADRVAVASLVAEVVTAFDHIDLLVNSGGIVIESPFEEIAPDDWDRVIAVNLTGTFNVIWAVKDGMIARRFGRIVNLTSIAALAARPTFMAYAASKAGVISLTKSCCAALGAHNVRINALAPGAIETDMLRELPQALIDKACAETPLGRVGEPEEMASVIAFLLSEDASFLTGTTIVASGGRLLVP